MNISQEITKLAEMRDKGILSDEEFQIAKKKVLRSDPAQVPEREMRKKYYVRDQSDKSLGKAANRYVSFQIIMTVIGLLVFLLLVGPRMCSSQEPFSRGPNFQFHP